jgi:hypothetical protein
MGVDNPSGNQTLILPDVSGTICTTGSVCSGYASVGGASNYIQLQSSTPGTAQTGNFNVSGTGIVSGSLLTALLDSPVGVTTLNIGTNNATIGINLNQTTSIASGKSFTVNGATLLQDSSNSATAFQIQNTAGTSN